MTRPSLRSLSQIPATPALVYDENAITKNIRCIRESFSGIPGLHHEIYFAVKACYVPTVLQHIRRMGVGAETMSHLEWRLARKAGFTGEQLICNGMGRPEELLDDAVRIGALIIIDTPGDLTRVSAIVERERRVARLGVRLQPDVIEFEESPYSTPEHKLGFVSGSAALKEILDAIKRQPRLKLDAIHAHVAQNATDPSIYVETMRQLGAFRELARQWGLPISSVDIGGGWRADGTTDEAAMPLLRTIAREAVRALPGAKLLLEPGRLLVNDAGFVVTTVRDLKEVSGRKTIVVLDAGTNVLIPIPTANYRLLDPAPIASDGIVCDLVDGITCPGNVIASSVHLRSLPNIGDRWVLADCGAYTSSMAEFWAFDPYVIYWRDTTGTLSPILSAEDISAARRHLLGI